MSEYRMIVGALGGPDRIEREAIDLPPPGPGEVRVRHRAVGLNFFDTYVRTGLYPAALPTVLGSEASGLVEACGEGVSNVAPGDAVAYATGPLGAYASARNMPAEHLVRLPAGVDHEAAAAVLLKGMTAAFLIGPCAKAQAGQTVLVYAAAGGVGSLLVQWLTAMGAVVIAHAGSAEKAAAAKANGAAHALHLPFDALADEVRRLTGGRGADIVLDGVGAASWQGSLGAIARRGMLVTYGNASGPVPPFSALALRDAGSIFVTRPTLADYSSTAQERQALADSVFEGVVAGTLGPEIGQHYPLAEAARAHADLEARATRGATILVP